MSQIRRPLIDQIKDQATRESLQWVFDYIQSETLLSSNFSHFEIEFNKAETELKIPHNLGFAPLDVIVTSVIGAGVPNFIYEKFTTANLVITTSGACVIRFLAGRYKSA